MVLEGGGYCDFQEAAGGKLSLCNRPAVAKAGKKRLCPEHARYYIGMTGEQVYMDSSGGRVPVGKKLFLEKMKEAENGGFE